jgi:hypothetical protein
MIEKHCIAPGCTAWPCFGNGKASACGAHKHIIGFGGVFPRSAAAARQDEAIASPVHPGANSSEANPPQGRLL